MHWLRKLVFELSVPIGWRLVLVSMLYALTCVNVRLQGAMQCLASAGISEGPDVADVFQLQFLSACLGR